MQFNVSWSDLKAFAAQRETPIQWILIKDLYCVAAIDGPLEVVAQITKKAIAPPGSDQLDFETNYKDHANSSPRGNVVQVLGKDTLALVPFGAYSESSLKAGTSSTWDIPLPYTMMLKGAEMYVPDAAMGDWCSVDVIDTSNLVGLGGTPEEPTMLGTYVLSWYIAPGQWNRIEDISISQTLPAGAILRITYHSTGDEDPHAILNFFAYSEGV